MTTGQKDRSFEVLKFGVAIAIPLITFAVGYGSMSAKVSQLEKDVAKLQAKVESIEDHNQQQDLETVKFRSNMNSRVENIENLTQEIHSAIVGRD